MAQDRGLGRCRGAAGEQLDGDPCAVIVFAAFGHRCGLSTADEIRPGMDDMALVTRQPVNPRRIANDQGRRDPVEQPCQIGIGEAIVERAIGHTRQARPEQRDHCGFAALVEQRNMAGAARLDELGRPACGFEQFGIGPALAVADQTNAIGRGFRRHLEEEGNVHGVGNSKAKSLLPSPAGSGWG